MQEPNESFNWRTVHAVVVLMVLAVFLYSIRGVLSPFLLFFLLVFVISPYQGTRHHLLIVSASALLTFVWVLDTTGFLLAPFVLALVLAYVQHPLVDRLEGKRVWKLRISRGLAVALLALPSLLLAVLVIFVGIPALAAEVADLVRATPAFIVSLGGKVDALERQLRTRDIPGVDEEALIAQLRSIQPDAVMEWLRQRQAAIGAAAWQGVLGVGKGLGAVLTILSYVFLTPILTFYLLRDWPKIETKAAALIPGPHRERVMALGREYDRLLSGYMRGQLTEAAIVGVLTWLGFWLLGFPYALLLGVVAGVFNVIPYMGLVVSAIPAVVIAIFTPHPLAALGKIAIVFAVVQVLDGSVLGPRIVGESVGLHPVWVILALAVFGFFFGFVGLLLAVPLAVLVKLLLRHALERYRLSRLFTGQAHAAAAIE